MTDTVLIVDDEPKARDLLAHTVERFGHRTLLAPDGAAALQLLEREPVDLIVSDIRMPSVDGRALTRTVRERWPLVPIVLVTAYGTVRDAVAMGKAGAFDYLEKPFDVGDLKLVITNGLALRTALCRRESSLGDESEADALLGGAPAFREVLTAISHAGETTLTVLLTGESGTGKEVVARAIHDRSARNDQPFVPVNCAAIPEQLLESELFGHTKGAFTGAGANRVGRFEQADGGTLFLDEIGDMPLPMQAKILRVIQDRRVEPVGGTASRTVDIRIIAATNKELEPEIQAGRFRQDLYYRLNVFPIHLPPLRERAEDIPVLAEQFRTRFARSMGKDMGGISKAALGALIAYGWPGNVRELRNCIERAVLLAQEEVIELSHLPAYVSGSSRTGIAGGTPSGQIPPGFRLDDDLSQFEKTRILSALEQTEGVQVRAAELLGITERSLRNRIQKLGLRTRKLSS